MNFSRLLDHSPWRAMPRALPVWLMALTIVQGRAEDGPASLAGLIETFTIQGGNHVPYDNRNTQISPMGTFSVGYTATGYRELSNIGTGSWGLVSGPYTYDGASGTMTAGYQRGTTYTHTFTSQYAGKFVGRIGPSTNYGTFTLKPAADLGLQIPSDGPPASNEVPKEIVPSPNQGTTDGGGPDSIKQMADNIAATTDFLAKNLGLGILNLPGDVNELAKLADDVATLSDNYNKGDGSFTAELLGKVGQWVVNKGSDGVGEIAAEAAIGGALAFGAALTPAVLIGGGVFLTVKYGASLLGPSIDASAAKFTDSTIDFLANHIDTVHAVQDLYTDSAI